MQAQSFSNWHLLLRVSGRRLRLAGQLQLAGAADSLGLAVVSDARNMQRTMRRLAHLLLRCWCQSSHPQAQPQRWCPLQGLLL